MSLAEHHHHIRQHDMPAPPTAYMVGQDRNGRWVAVETHGFGGALFRTQHDAIAFAEFETDYRPGGVHLTTTRIELFE